MKTRNLIFAILWTVLAIAMLVCAVAQFYAAEYLFAMIAAIAFCCDAYSAWVHFGVLLETFASKKRMALE